MRKNQQGKGKTTASREPSRFNRATYEIDKKRGHASAPDTDGDLAAVVGEAKFAACCWTINLIGWH